MQDTINLQATSIPSRNTSCFYGNSKKLRGTTIQKAISALGLSSIEGEKLTKLYKFISQSFSNNHCVVICEKIGNNKDFFDNLGIDIGKQEVLITENQKVFYTNNFTIPPTSYAEI